MSERTRTRAYASGRDARGSSRPRYDERGMRDSRASGNRSGSRGRGGDARRRSSSGRPRDARQVDRGRRRNTQTLLLGMRLPLVMTLLSVLLSVGVSVFATRCAMQPKIDAANESAKEVKEEATTLSKEVSRLNNELKTAQAAAEQVANKGVEDSWLSSGKFTTGDETLDKEVKEFCDGIATSGQDQATAALEVYKSIAWSEYVERDDAQHPSGKDWRTEYARKYYEHDCSGNCYEFAAFLSYCLRYLGYTDAVAEGVEVELQSGGWGDHGIVYVTDTDGRDCLCDTSRGVDGWMLDVDSYNVRIVDFENASAQ